MGSPVESTIRPIAAFFDLDKTIISRSSTLVFGPSFYRHGLISRSDVVRGALAQIAFRLGGASHQRMEKIRDQVSHACRGWPADRVAEIVTRNLHDLIVPHVYAEARALLTEHRTAGQDVIIVSTSGQEMVAPIGALLGASSVIATRMEVADGLYTGQVEFYAYGEAKAEQVRALAAERGYSLPRLLRLQRLGDGPADAGDRWPPPGGEPGPRAAQDRAAARLAGAHLQRAPGGPGRRAARRHVNQATNRDHRLVTPRVYAHGLIRRRKVSRTNTSGHGDRAPTRDQPREASRGTDCRVDGYCRPVPTPGGRAGMCRCTLGNPA